MKFISDVFTEIAWFGDQYHRVIPDWFMNFLFEASLFFWYIADNDDDDPQAELWREVEVGIASLNRVKGFNWIEWNIHT